MTTLSSSRAVLVAIQTPGVTREELDGSLHELSRLVKTLGYQVVGHVTQKRNSEKFSTVLGQGKLTELARWTGGPGTIGMSFEKPMHKAALKQEATESDEVDDFLEEEPEDPCEGFSLLINRRRLSSWIAICRRHN